MTTTHTTPTTVAAKAARGGTAVHLRGLHRQFGPTRALDGLDLQIQPGELIALLGPSGCGKTTALRVLAGMETVDSGEVLVDGVDVRGVPTRRRDMGMVFQNYSLFPNLSALDNVGFGLRVRRRATAERTRRAAELLEMVGLAAQATKYPHQMSGGQQQRVALARALAIEPRVLLLDEPLSALDATVRLQLRDQIRLLQTTLGTTTLFVTHDQQEALSMADRVGVMRAGRLEQIAEPAQLYANPATAFVAEFVGTMNRLTGRVVPGGVHVLGSLTTCDTDGRALGTVVDVLARPEDLTVARAPHDDAQGVGLVTTRTFLGGVTRVTVRMDPAPPADPSQDASVQVDLPSGEASLLAVGLAVKVSVTGRVLVVDPA